MCTTKNTKGLPYSEMTEKTRDFYDNYCRGGLLIPMEQVVKTNSKIKGWSVEMECEVMFYVFSIQRGSWIDTNSVIDKTEYTIRRFKKIHGNKYDYSKVEYKKSTEKVDITCGIHGEFKQSVDKHLSGRGCPKCAYLHKANKLRSSTDEFIERAKDIHGDKYDYSKVNYINAHEKVDIICPDHGEFKQEANGHLNGYGCFECAVAFRSNEKRSSTDEFIEKAKLVHGDKYDYSEVNYVDNSSKVDIICPDHGKFEQSPGKHLQKRNCPTCGLISSADKRRSSTDEFIEKAKLLHGNKYDYSKVEYIDNSSKVEIICPDHGKFEQTPSGHLSERGRSACNISSGEVLISKYLTENEIYFTPQKKFKKCKNKRPLPFDFYLPDYNLCVEYDGIQHYMVVDHWGEESFKRTQEHDQIKNDYCNENGIDLLRIPYYEKDNINEILDNYFSNYN